MERRKDFADASGGVGGLLDRAAVGVGGGGLARERAEWRWDVLAFGVRMCSTSFERRESVAGEPSGRMEPVEGLAWGRERTVFIIPGHRCCRGLQNQMLDGADVPKPEREASG